MRFAGHVDGNAVDRATGEPVGYRPAAAWYGRKIAGLLHWLQTFRRFRPRIRTRLRYPFLGGRTGLVDRLCHPVGLQENIPA
jgi:hypothetical protein